MPDPGKKRSSTSNCNWWQRQGSRRKRIHVIEVRKMLWHNVLGVVSNARLE
jgi:hypothetical protein